MVEKDPTATTPAYSLWQMVGYMTKLGSVGFGGPVALCGYMYRDLVESRKWISEGDYKEGLTLAPFLYGGVVNDHQWLNERQFVDAVAVAMITPGPVVITVGFIGYLVAGIAGAIVAALATFLPCYLLTIFPAPYFRKHGKRPSIVAFVDGVTAAAIGTIAGAVVVLGKRSIIDLPSLAIALIATLLLWKLKKLPEPAVIAAAAAAGLMFYPLLKG